jgi:hypothetical protein
MYKKNIQAHEMKNLTRLQNPESNFIPLIVEDLLEFVHQYNIYFYPQHLYFLFVNKDMKFFPGQIFPKIVP